MSAHPTSRNPSALQERDYARYGRRRTGAPPLPSAPSDVAPYAQRIYRSRLGAMLSASLLPAFSLVLAWRYIVLVLFPSLTSTQAPSDQARQVGEFAAGAGIGLAVALPLLVLSVTGFLVAAYRETASWMGLAPDSSTAAERATFGRAARTIARGLLSVLSLLLIGVVLLIVGGVLAAAFGERSAGEGVGGAVVIVGTIVVVAGAFFALIRSPRAFGAVPLALYEGITPKEAIRRAKELAQPRIGSLPGASTEGAVAGAMFLILLLLSGFTFLMGSIGLQEGLAQLFSSPMVRLAAGEFVAGLPLYLTVLFILPYLALLNVVGYFERRVSVEGLDIELMAARLEEPAR